MTWIRNPTLLLRIGIVGGWYPHGQVVISFETLNVCLQSCGSSATPRQDTHERPVLEIPRPSAVGRNHLYHGGHTFVTKPHGQGMGSVPRLLNSSIERRMWYGGSDQRGTVCCLPLGQDVHSLIHGVPRTSIQHQQFLRDTKFNRQLCHGLGLTIFSRVASSREH